MHFSNPSEQINYFLVSHICLRKSGFSHLRKRNKQKRQENISSGSSSCHPNKNITIVTQLDRGQELKADVPSDAWASIVSKLVLFRLLAIRRLIFLTDRVL